MKLVILLVTVGLAVAQQEGGLTNQAAPKWSNEPDSYRGLKFGASESEAKHIFQGVGRCVAAPKGQQATIGDRACVTQYELGEVSVRGFLVFVDGKFVKSISTFDSRSFDKVRDIITERYGPPHVTLGDKLGWTGKDVTISLGRGITQSVFALGLVSFEEATKEAEKAAKKKAAEKM